MDVTIRVLSTGYFITIKKNGEVIEELACNKGKWNLGKILNKYVYAEEEKPKKIKPKKKSNKRKLS